MAKMSQRVEKAAKSIGKGVCEQPQTMEPKDYALSYKEKRLAEIEKIKVERMQYLYGKFLEVKTMNVKECMEITNYSEHIAKENLRMLTELGLIRSHLERSSGMALTYTIINEWNIPSGWPAKGVLMNMDPPFMGDREKHKTDGKPKKTSKNDASDNPLTKMLMTKDLHVADVSSYEQLMKDTSKMYGLDEIDDLVKAIHDICKVRIEQKYIECPLCKGRIQRLSSTAHCTKCGVEINGGTFENSVKMLNAIAKTGVRMQ